MANLLTMSTPTLSSDEHLTSVRRRPLKKLRVMTGKERRWMNPNRGLIKRCERFMDILVTRFVYPLMGHLWNPYSWLLERRFALAETKLAPQGWPVGMAPLRVLLITDIHAGIFLMPETFAGIVDGLMQAKPDLVVICGDMVSGHTDEAIGILDGLKHLTRAPLGAWFCFGNHDYYGGNPNELQANLAGVGIQTLKNESIALNHHGKNFVLGGIDDRIMGKPNWNGLLSRHGRPDLLLAHNPDHFYEAETHGIPLTLSGHTHGGQIRLPNGPAIIRHSRFCLDEGVYGYRSSMLVVSRGLGSVVLPLRWGADPEAVLIEIESQ
jgi:predicted MPP superfamily phosphohydrolase